MEGAAVENKQSELVTFVFSRSILAMLLLWLSFPPVGLYWLAWLALVPLIHAILDHRRFLKRHYWAIWAAGLFYWLGTFYFIPIPHPLLWFGWLAVSLYLACYLPFAVLAARTMIFRFRIPALVAIPVVWTGFELLRSRLFTGMPLVCLSHSQYQLPAVIQISDLSGAYILTFAIALFSTALGVCLHWHRRSVWQIVSTILVMVLVAGSIGGYGYYQLGRENEKIKQPIVVALIQGSVDTVFPDTVEQAREHYRYKTDQYIGLTNEASSQYDDIDLVVWPENGWPFPDLEPGTDISKMAPEQVREYHKSIHLIWHALWQGQSSMPHFLVGAESYDPVKDERYASALSISNEAKIVDRYYKQHLVMFGEYTPLSQWIPALRKLPAIGTGLQAGNAPAAMRISNLNIAPNICFESTVPHFIRNQINELAANEKEPDILVNMTNDGWFFGTSCLDFHLACNVFRAVEMRKPLVVCANTGFSAVINEKGEIKQQGPRRQTAVLRAKVTPVQKTSPYRTIGDTIPIAFATLAVVSLLTGLFFPLPQQNNPD